VTQSVLLRADEATDSEISVPARVPGVLRGS